MEPILWPVERAKETLFDEGLRLIQTIDHKLPPTSANSQASSAAKNLLSKSALLALPQTDARLPSISKVLGQRLREGEEQVRATGYAANSNKRKWEPEWNCSIEQDLTQLTSRINPF